MGFVYDPKISVSLYHTVGVGQRKSPRIVSRIGPPRTKIAVADLGDSDHADRVPAEREVPWFRSAAALMLAAGLHVLIAMIAAAVVLAERREDPPVVDVALPAAEVIPKKLPPPPPEKNNLTFTAASGSTAEVLLEAAAAVVSIPIPDVLPSDDAIDFGGGGGGLGLGFGGGIGKLGGADFFGIPAGGGASSLALVLDVSGSMISLGDDGIQAMKDQVDKTLTGLDPIARFNLFTFAGEADGFRERSVSATEENRKAARFFLRDYLVRNSGFSETRTARFGNGGADDKGIRYVPITGGDFRDLEGSAGSTRIELGVLAAMRDKPEVIFVLSDGEPSSSIDGKRMTGDVLIKIIEENRDRNYGRFSKLTIHTISVGGIGGNGKRFLRGLARAFGGRYSNVDLKNL